MYHSPKYQLKMIYKHILISLLILIVYISISIIIINDLNYFYYIVPTILSFLLINLIIEVYSTNKLVSLIFIVFICLIFYSNFQTRKEEHVLKNFVNIFEYNKENIYETVGLYNQPAKLLIKSHSENILKIRNSTDQEYNIFFVETNLEHNYFTSKQLCAIESAAFHNTKSNVIVLSIKALLKDNRLFEKYKNIAWFKFIPKEIFIDTPLWDWWLSGKVFKSQFMTAHLSDAARLALLWKFGGFYSDLDTITIKSYESLNGYSGAGFINGIAPSLANGFLHFRVKHPFLKLVMENFANDYNPTIWGHNGPTLLKRMMAQYCQVDNIYQSLFLLNHTSYINNGLDDNIKIKYKNKCDIYVYPQEYFYPYNNYQMTYLFGKNAMLNISAFINTYSVHFYGKVSTKYRVDFRDNNVYEHFSSSNCELTYYDFKNRNVSFV